MVAATKPAPPPAPDDLSDFLDAATALTLAIDTHNRRIDRNRKLQRKVRK
jgi:hypothetical protein